MNAANGLKIEKAEFPSQPILLVEDDNAIAELLEQLIAQETLHRVVVASDGPQALELAKEVKPQLFILDYGLPSMHGIELYDRLHIMEGLEKTPAIMLSANLPLQEVRRRKLMYLKKPFDVSRLLNLILESIG